ncbi:hypothetical protein FOFC_21435 [Fusarium oxysporum]|nr:hypothetical protein FOFC_21435 [Fusarium oxysporum]
MAEEQKNVEVPQETKPETTPAPATDKGRNHYIHSTLDQIEWILLLL